MNTSLVLRTITRHGRWAALLLVLAMLMVVGLATLGPTPDSAVSPTMALNYTKITY